MNYKINHLDDEILQLSSISVNVISVLPLKKKTHFLDNRKYLFSFAFNSVKYSHLNEVIGSRKLTCKHLIVFVSVQVGNGVWCLCVHLALISFVFLFSIGFSCDRGVRV